MESPASHALGCTGTHDSADGRDGIYVCDISVPKFSDPGIWALQDKVRDVIFNSATYTQTQIEATGFPHQISIASIPVLTEISKLLPSDGRQPEQFGYSTSISGNRALVSAVLANSRGAAYVFDYDGSVWVESAKLTASDGVNGDVFGWSVALDGNRAVIGAKRDSENGTNSGSVYVFEFDGDAWKQTAKLLPSDGEADAEFGSSVAVAGNRVMIGAWHDNDNGVNSGSAYVFDYRGKRGNETAKILPTDGVANALFGYAIDLDTKRAVISARRDGAIGSVYVFELQKKTWTQSQKLVSSDRLYDDEFGYSLSLDGNRLLIGARLDDEDGTNAGSAYVFDYTGTSWTESEKIVVTDHAAGDEVGVSVALEGDWALIGAWRDDDNGESSGSAYLYNFDGSNWLESKKLLPSDGVQQAYFGWDVSMDAGLMLIGAKYDSENGSQSGSAYMFTIPVSVNDDDRDSVSNAVDMCPSTAIPETSVPSSGKLGNNRWALLDGDTSFDTVIKGKGKGKGKGLAFTTTDTGGCSCEQIIEAWGLKKGEQKKGCKKKTMENWVAYVVAGASKGGQFTNEFQSESEPESALPHDYVLIGNYPNPFNPMTTIRFDVPDASKVSLTVYDMLGRQVVKLVDGIVSAGEHKATFDARSLPSGAYIYRLVTPERTFTKTMLLLK